MALTLNRSARARTEQQVEQQCLHLGAAPLHTPAAKHLRERKVSGWPKRRKLAQ
jgi:hypothetical protein